jgi:hypothetical protein
MLLVTANLHRHTVHPSACLGCMSLHGSHVPGSQGPASQDVDCLLKWQVPCNSNCKHNNNTDSECHAKSFSVAHQHESA